MASAGRKGDKNVSDTPEFSTTRSSVPSIDEEAALLHGRSVGESSSGRPSRSRVKKKKDASESSTSGPPVHQAEAHPLQSSAQTTWTKCSRKTTAPSESPTTQSSVVSVDDPHLISSSSQASSIKSRQGKPAPSESSTQSSMPSADNEDAHLLPRTSSSKSPQKHDTAASKRSNFESCTPSSRNAQRRSPEKSSHAVPESKSSRSSPKSPSKSPSTLRRMAKTIIDAFTTSKSPKGATSSRSRSKSASHRKTYPEFGSPKISDESKEPASNSEMISRENVENVQPSSSSNSGGRVLSDDASQAETPKMQGCRPKVPQPKTVESSPKRGIFSKFKMTLAPHDGKVDKSSSDASPKSSSKSATSSSSVSPVSRQRQESDTSNLSWDPNLGSRTSNSKSSSTSCANDEYLLPQMASQFLRCSPNKSRGDSKEGTSSDSGGCRPRQPARSQPGTVEFARSMLFTHIVDPCPSEAQEHNFGTEPVTENFDDFHLEEADRRRSRSLVGRFVLKHIIRGSSSKNDDPPVKKGKERDSSDDRGATARRAANSPPQNACQHAQSTSDQPVRPGQLSIRHESVSPECKHKQGYLLSPGCTEVRRARIRRNRRRIKQDDNINDAVIDVRNRVRRVRTHLTCLTSVLSALDRLRSGAGDASRSLTEEDVDQGMRKNLDEKIRDLQTEIGELYDSTSPMFNNVRRQFLQEENAALAVMNETDPDNVEACRLGIKRLNVSLGVVEDYEEQLVDIRTSIPPILQDIRTRLVEIQEQVEEIRTNIGWDLMQQTERHLNLMMQDMETIFRKLDGELN